MDHNDLSSKQLLDRITKLESELVQTQKELAKTNTTAEVAKANSAHQWLGYWIGLTGGVGSIAIVIWASLTTVTSLTDIPKKITDQVEFKIRDAQIDKRIEDAITVRGKLMDSFAERARTSAAEIEVRNDQIKGRIESLKADLERKLGDPSGTWYLLEFRPTGDSSRYQMNGNVISLRKEFEGRESHGHWRYDPATRRIEVLDKAFVPKYQLSVSNDGKSGFGTIKDENGPAFVLGFTSDDLDWMILAPNYLQSLKMVERAPLSPASKPSAKQ